jgi:hypothetical protein
MKIYEENPYLVKIEQKVLGTLCKNLHSLLPVTRVTISIVDSDIVQQYRRNTDLHFLAKVFGIDHIYHGDMCVNSAKENASLCVGGNSGYVNMPKCNLCENLNLTVRIVHSV